MGHVAAVGGCHTGRTESVYDLLDLLVRSGGVYLDVRMIDEDVVEVRNLQTCPFFAV